MMSIKRTLYDLLGVSETATPEEIKKAYREKAKMVHPDTGGSRANPEKFGALVRAYDVLSDAQRRARYDETGIEDESTTSDNKHAIVLQEIQGAVLNIIKQLVAQNLPVSRADVIGLADQAFAQNIQRIKGQRDDHVRELTQFQDAQERFRCKKGDEQNLLKRMMGVQIAACQQTLDRIDADVVKFETAREMLKDYSFEVEPTPTQLTGSCSHMPGLMWDFQRAYPAR